MCGCKPWQFPVASIHRWPVQVIFHNIFPECVARVPVSLWGSGGWGCVRSTLLNRSQPSAWLLYGRAYGQFCRRGRFWRFQTSRCFVSRGRRGTSWHSDALCNVSKKSFGVAGAILLRRFRKMSCSFRGRRSTLDVSIVILRGKRMQAQRFRRGVLRVFCESHCQGCVKWRQGANSVAGVAFCEMWWKLAESSHETSILR